VRTNLRNNFITIDLTDLPVYVQVLIRKAFRISLYSVQASPFSRFQDCCRNEAGSWCKMSKTLRSHRRTALFLRESRYDVSGNRLSDVVAIAPFLLRIVIAMLMSSVYRPILATLLSTDENTYTGQLLYSYCQTRLAW